MRRNDRELTGIEALNEILQKGDACRLALVDGTEPYVVTLNYGFEWNGPFPVFWFHCAREGRKLDIIKKNSAGCLVIDIDHELITGPAGCDWGMKFRSVVASGKLELVDDPAEKKRGLDSIMAHYSDRGEFDYDPRVFQVTSVLKFIASSITGKKKG